MTIEVGFHYGDFSRVTIVVDFIRETTHREPTEEEIEKCPPEFTCYVCGEKRSKEQFAGEACGQRVCRICSPYASDYHVGRMIRWDERRGYRSFVRGY